MYYCEWLLWKTKIDLQQSKEKDEELDKLLGFEEITIYEEDIKAEQADAKKSVIRHPTSRGPVYICTDYVLEIRCGLYESYRGLVTIATLFIAAIIIQMGDLLLYEAHHFYKYSSVYSTPYYWITIASILLSTLMTFGPLGLFLRYGINLYRLELFNTRHLLVRFNRKSQQVYLHRPKKCGGLVVLPWEGIISTGANTDPDESAGLGVPLFLAWPAGVTKTLHTEMVAVGRQGNNLSELRSEWEFIRRFMDEGPEHLPRPKITSHFPWPLQAFRAQFEGQSNTWSNANGLIRLGLIMISPALLLFGTAHWISLMLCWKPRWPKIIREAGQPGKPIPPFTTLADYPEHIQQRLRENAHLWAPMPGSRPENHHGKVSTEETTKDEA